MPSERSGAVLTRALGLTRHPAALSVLVLVVTALSMTLGVAMHDTCLGYEGGPPIGSQTCVSDIPALYKLRDLADHVFPYGAPGEFGLPDGTVEYPVLTGLIAWLVAWPAAVVPSAEGYYLVTSVVLLVVAFAVSSLLVRLAGRRALLFAASPLLMLYGTQNWDLFPVLFTVAGVLAWHRGRAGAAGVMFALGACFKIFPLLFLIPLYADVRARHGRSAALRAVAPGVVTGVLVNLPFMVRDVHGWWQPFAFQQARPVDESALSIWSLTLPTTNLPLVNALTTFALLVGVAVILFAASRRFEREGAYPVVQVCGAFVLLWLVTAKASSPQFALWALPFFVLLRVPLWTWLATTAAVVWCHVAFYAWIGNAITAAAAGEPGPQAHLAAPVLTRIAVFAIVMIVFMRSAHAIDSAAVTYRRGHDDGDDDLAAPAGRDLDGSGDRGGADRLDPGGSADLAGERGHAAAGARDGG